MEPGIVLLIIQYVNIPCEEPFAHSLQGGLRTICPGPKRFEPFSYAY